MKNMQRNGFPVYRLDKEESIGKNGKRNFELVSAGEVKRGC